MTFWGKSYLDVNILSMPNCLNCNDPWEKGEIYCSSCGQKTKVPNLNLWTLITDFFQNIFNIEAKIWKTLKDIWIPAKITMAYLHGQRVTYYNPIRIFLISLFALFGLILYISGNEIDKANTFSESQKKLVWEEEVAVRLDTIFSDNGIDTTLSKKLKKAFLKDNIKIEITDSDTVISSRGDVIQFSGFNGNEELSANDIFKLSDSEFSEKYKDKTRTEKLFSQQIRKIFNDPSNGIKYAIGNSAWALIALIIMLAVFYKLLYLRHDFLFVEHFLFHLNGHTRLLLIGIIFCPVIMFSGFHQWYLGIIYLIGGIYLFTSTKKFYKQGWIKTFLKTLLGLAAYFFIATLCITGIMFISLLIF